MTAVNVATLVAVGIAALSSIGAVLLLAYRVGRLTGSIEARLQVSETDRVNIWRQIGALVGKMDRHIEGHGG